MLNSVVDRLARSMINRARPVPVPRSVEGAEVATDAHIYPSASIESSGPGEVRVRVGAGSHVRGQLLTRQEGRIEVGRRCYIGEGSRLVSRHSIRLGDGVLISHLVDIDDDACLGSVEADDVRNGVSFDRNERPSRGIVIDDDAWICLKSTILRGVTVGRGAIVAAGAVVLNDVPPMTIVAGNPARVVGQIPNRVADSAPGDDSALIP